VVGRGPLKMHCPLITVTPANLSSKGGKPLSGISERILPLPLLPLKHHAGGQAKAPLSSCRRSCESRRRFT
jgi:hypothetical protein